MSRWIVSREFVDAASTLLGKFLQTKLPTEWKNFAFGKTDPPLSYCRN